MDGSPVDPRNLAQPSRFWERLAGQHARDLESYGFEVIKRRQALRYFTWRWDPAGLWRSEQLRFLLANQSLRRWAACALEKAELSRRAWLPLRWGRLQRWTYTFAVRLLWEYATRHGSEAVLALPEPGLGGPPPVIWRGRLISQDLANSALEAKAILRALAGRDPPMSILEIGAGYGRTAYWLLSLLPEATYTIVDIEPALSISRWYLSQLFPGERLRFLNPASVDVLASGSVDLALSISSLQEMTPGQVADYLALLDRVAEGGVVYLKQWATWTNPADGVTLCFDAYPYPARWKSLFRSVAPVQTRFREAAWSVGRAAPRVERAGVL